MDPELSPKRVAGGVGRVRDDWLRDSALVGVVLLSLGVVLVSLAARDRTVGSLGLVVGAIGAAAAFTPLAKGWSIGRAWWSLLGITVVDLLAIVVVLAG